MTGRRARQLSSLEIEQARALKTVMSWKALADLYGMNRWTLMYQIMPDEKREDKKLKMRATNRTAYARNQAERGLSRRQKYKQRYGLDWDHVRTVRDSIRDKVKKNDVTDPGGVYFGRDLS
jgi:hypothetical protein